GIADRQQYALPGGQVCQALLFLLKSNITGLDSQLSAVGHRVAGVDDQVHDHLLGLPHVCPDAPAPRVGVQLNVDILPDQAADHVFHAAQQDVQVEHDRGDHLAAAERQQLPRQGGGPLAGSADLGQGRAERVAGGQLRLGQVGVAKNDGQQVVEVV